MWTEESAFSSKYKRPSRCKSWFPIPLCLSLIPIGCVILCYVFWRNPITDSEITANCTLTNCTSSIDGIAHFMINIEVDGKNYSNPGMLVFESNDDSDKLCKTHFITCYYLNTDIADTLTVQNVIYTLICDIILMMLFTLICICWCIPCLSLLDVLNYIKW